MATYYSNTDNLFRLRLQVDITSQSQPNNTSTVAFKLYLESGWEMEWTTNRYLDVNGTRVYHQTGTLWSAPHGEVLLHSGTMVVGHDAQGNKTLPLSAYLMVTNGTAYYTPQSGLTLNANMTLTRIPRNFYVRVGNGSNKPVIGEVYVGNSSNKPVKAKEVYVGNSSNKPVKAVY